MGYAFRLWVRFIFIFGELCALGIGSCGCSEWPGWDLKCNCNGCDKKYALVRRIWSDKRAVSECQEAVRAMDSTLVGKGNEGEGMVGILQHEESHSHAMPMSFMATTNTVILWDWWRVSATLPYLLSCLACALMAFVSVAIKVYTPAFIAWLQARYPLKQNRNAKHTSQPNTPQTATSLRLPILHKNAQEKGNSGENLNTGKNIGHSDIELKTLVEDEKCRKTMADDEICKENFNTAVSTPRSITILKIAMQSAVYTLDYLVMLVVMTYNVGLFFSCIFGISLGTIAFAPAILATPPNHLTPACCSL